MHSHQEKTIKHNFYDKTFLEMREIHQDFIFKIMII